MKVVLKPEAGPVVTVAEGAIYHHEFRRDLSAEGGFEVDEAAWPILERTGLFEAVKSEELKVKNEKPKRNS